MIENVGGILFDLDGVVHVGDTAIDGAAGALDALRARGIPYSFLTNTTTRSPAQLHKEMQHMGLPIAAEEIFTTHEVAAAQLRDRGRPTCLLLVDDQAKAAYHDIPQAETEPEYVVIGDIGSRWNYDILNDVFGHVMNGAKMMALHGGRFWQTPDGLRMDIGCFVAGLEYTTGASAEIVGKPSAAFFELGLQAIGVHGDRAIMVGDDIESDIGGAQSAGIRGVLVKTGKYRGDTLSRSAVDPYAIIDSIAALPELLA